MLMPHVGGYRYIVQACCTLTAYPEWHMLQSKSASVLVSFIFEDLLCRWGAISEIITDNSPAFIKVLCILASRYTYI